MQSKFCLVKVIIMAFFRLRSVTKASRHDLSCTRVKGFFLSKQKAVNSVNFLLTIIIIKDHKLITRKKKKSVHECFLTSILKQFYAPYRVQNHSCVKFMCECDDKITRRKQKKIFRDIKARQATHNYATPCLRSFVEIIMSICSHSNKLSSHWNFRGKRRWTHCAM